MPISMQSNIIRSTAPVEAPVDDELVMADIDAGKYYGLNDIATAIWQNLETKITVHDLCAKLCESYDVTHEQCAADVLAFLKELAERNLVVIEN